MMRLPIVLFMFIGFNSEQVAGGPSESLPQQESNPLNQKHVRLIATPLPGIFDLKRNSTGHAVQSAGPVSFALDWLSLRYNFTYSYIPMTGPNIVVDDLPNQRGGMTFLRQRDAELYLGALVATSERFKDADVSSPWMSSPYSILIPIPNSSTNIGALVQPMSTEVWICVCLSVPAVMASLFGLSKGIAALNKRMGSKRSEVYFRDNFQMIDYVICILLSQGAYCGNRQLAIRFAAAAWCLACFVLVQAYSSTLIAFITSPNNKPIINSVYDIPKVPGLKITVNRNFAADLRLLQTNFSIFRKLGDSLREDPNLRCNKTELCLDKVRSGDHVYIHGKPVIQKIIAMDREQTGSCHFTMAKESFWPGHLYFFLPKKSPYTETINRGILRMQETGILGKWIETFNPEATKCSLKFNIKKSGKPRISLKNLTSAFTLLIFGICVSILALVIELIYLHHFTSSR